MQIVPNDVNNQDRVQWLADGWVWIRHDGQLVLAKVRHIGNHRLMFQTQALDIPDVPNAAIVVHWPLLGYVNVPGVKIAMCMERTVRKQWSRTYQPEYVTTTVPRSTYLVSPDDVALSIGSHDYAVVSAAFEPAYYGVAEALAMFERDGWRSCAITRNTMITNEEQPVILNRGQKIGVIARPFQLELVAHRVVSPRFLKLFEGYEVYDSEGQSCL